MSQQPPSRLFKKSELAGNEGEVVIVNATGDGLETAPSDTTEAWLLIGNTISGLKYLGTINAAALRIITNNIERIHILPTGEVGIGGIPDANFRLMVQNEGFISNIRNKTASNGDDPSGFNLQRSRGTLLVPLAILSGDRVGVHSHNGFDGTIWENGARMTAYATENWATGAHGMGYLFETVLNGTTVFVPRLRIESAGIGIGVTLPTASLNIKAGSTAASSAPIKKSSGTLMTTAEVGAEEYNGNFYQTKFGPLRYGMGGVIATFQADVANVGTAETDLFSYTLPINGLSGTGQSLKANFSGSHLDATATPRWQVYFAGSVIADTTALAVSAAGQWDCDVVIIRAGSNARCRVTFKVDGATIVTTVHRINLAVTFGNTNILKITGTATGAGGGSGDIIAEMGIIEIKAAANN